MLFILKEKIKWYNRYNDKGDIMKKGKLIVIEGACDGIGKTTQYNLLKEYLKKEDQNIVSHHFPSYETYQAIPVEKYLRGELGNPNELSPYFINSLYIY